MDPSGAKRVSGPNERLYGMLPRREIVFAEDREFPGVTPRPHPDIGCCSRYAGGVREKKPAGRAGPRIERVDLRRETKGKLELHRGPDDVSFGFVVVASRFRDKDAALDPHRDELGSSAADAKRISESDKNYRWVSHEVRTLARVVPPDGITATPRLTAIYLTTVAHNCGYPATC